MNDHPKLYIFIPMCAISSNSYDVQGSSQQFHPWKTCKFCTMFHLQFFESRTIDTSACGKRLYVIFPSSLGWWDWDHMSHVTCQYLVRSTFEESALCSLWVKGVLFNVRQQIDNVTFYSMHVSHKVRNAPMVRTSQIVCGQHHENMVKKPQHHPSLPRHVFCNHIGAYTKHHIYFYGPHYSSSTRLKVFCNPLGSNQSKCHMILGVKVESSVLVTKLQLFVGKFFGMNHPATR